MVELAYRSGYVKDVSAGLVRDGDDFTYREGTRPVLDHSPSGPPGEREVVAAYAVARLRTGGAPFVVTYPEDWAKAQKRSAAGSRNAGPWVTDWTAMVRKTAVRRLQPFLPQSPQSALAAVWDDHSAPRFDDPDAIPPVQDDVSAPDGTVGDGDV
jgi:recombination protein RecT